MRASLYRARQHASRLPHAIGLVTAADWAARSVLGSWVGVRRLFHLSLSLTAYRMVLPKILVLDAPAEASSSRAPGRGRKKHVAAGQATVRLPRRTRLPADHHDMPTPRPARVEQAPWRRYGATARTRRTAIATWCRACACAGTRACASRSAARWARPCTLEHPFVWRKGVLNGY